MLKTDGIEKLYSNFSHGEGGVGAGGGAEDFEFCLRIKFYWILWPIF